MRFSVRSLLAVMLVAALTLVIYLWMNAPPVLRIGMDHADAIAALETAQATDMILQKGYSTYHVWVPYGNTPIDDLEKVEYDRELCLPYSEETLQTFWYLPDVGRFEVSFDKGKLISILRWNGADNESVDFLILKH